MHELVGDVAREAETAGDVEVGLFVLVRLGELVHPHPAVEQVLLVGARRGPVDAAALAGAHLDEVPLEAAALDRSIARTQFSTPSTAMYL